ncbi:TIGR04255 family protein [Specibacter cremeus]|uniref:TIGR04255 family protein n=1 Tax=Specibacter cremeus TaxID=1629051 RepID=UPI00197C734B|nr:TIGR04255 family protein [Specibacter cremeus]
MTTDLPLGDLPSVDNTLLSNAPLEVAICEVRFTSARTEVRAETAARIRDVLVETMGIDFPSIQVATQGTMQINLNAGAPSWSGDQTTGWQVASTDGQHSATVFPGSVIWQVGAYERWSVSMRAPLKVLLNSLAADQPPSLVQRVGLRYVDRFVDPACHALGDWSGKIDTTLLGPVGNKVFGSKVRGAQQQIEIALDGRHGAILRHGPIPDQETKSVNYLLDIDIFANAAVSFDVIGVLDTAERLNRTALSLFQACVSAEYLRTLKGEGDD